MRVLIELGPIRLDLTIGYEEEPEEELAFGFVPADLFATELAVED